MQKRVIKICVLSIVFVAALVGFSHYLNRGNGDMTADMGTATFPVLSFAAYEQEVNSLVGHVNEMDMSAVRNNVTPLNHEGKIAIKIWEQEKKISKIFYEVYEIDGEKKLQDKKEVKPEKTVILSLGDILKKGTEGFLKMQLQLEDGQKLYYYARISNSENASMSECIDFVKTLHTNIIEKKNTEDIKAVMESNENGDNTTLQHVTIHSDLSHITWGELKPQVLGKVKWNISETKEAYTSVQLQYRVKCVVENGKEETYMVKEFFRVKCADGKKYLFTYDRTMEEFFVGSKAVLTSKGINLGITGEDVQYKTNEAGTIVTFVQANEMWSYNLKEKTFSLIFSFLDSEKEDERNFYDEHSLKILAMEENGDVTFAVHGYMNRGVHEGESGAIIYYFDLSKNVIEEKAFIRSNQSHVVTEAELGEVAYYNDKDDILYLLNEGTLYKIQVESGEKEVLLDSLEHGQYVTSEEGTLLAYQKSKNPSEAEVLDFSKDVKQTVKVGDGEVIQPLGFVMGDFIYGIARTGDEGKTTAGEDVLAMYKLEIRDAKNKVVKDYQVDGCYILKVKIEDNMVTLDRAVWQNGAYSQINEDYITNNEEEARSVMVESQWSDLKETQFSLTFEEKIEHKKVKVLEPKQVLFERDSLIEFKQSKSEGKYVVYGRGEMVGAYEEAGDALRIAKDVEGVVVSPRQRIVWEDGNRVAWYRNFNMRAFVTQAGETGLASCVRAVLAYEGQTINVMEEMATKSAMQILDEHCGGEAVWVQGCSSSDMRYLIDKGTPVIAITGGDNAIVLVGYDAKTITYINPANGGTASKTFSAIDEMIAGSGNTFLVYMK